MSDGRKVVVIGQLNTVESIVQEIFVTEQGDEIPNWSTLHNKKDLHDKPVISYKKKEEIKLEETLAKLKAKQECSLQQNWKDEGTTLKLMLLC